MRVAIVSNKQRLTQIPLPKIVGPKKSDPIKPSKTISLKPGMNLVDSEDWARAQQSKLVRDYQKIKIAPNSAPEAREEKVGQPYLLVAAEGLPDEAPLAGMEFPRAQAMISEMLQVPVLKQWLEEESRPEFRREIEKKLRLLETGK